MKFTIKREVTKVEETEVEVVLEKDDDGIYLTVNGWYIFNLNNNGTGEMAKDISSGSGLQLDKDGRIVLEDS